VIIAHACYVRSIARHAIHLQLNISAKALEIRAVKSLKYIVWCAVSVQPVKKLKYIKIATVSKYLLPSLVPINLGSAQHVFFHSLLSYVTSSIHLISFEVYRIIYSKPSFHNPNLTSLPVGAF
jgi:hypothetical protein